MRLPAVERVVTVRSATLDDIEAAARRGDPAAFGAFLRQVDHDLRGVVWAVVRDRHGVDDVMQVAYEKAFRAIGSFAGTSSLKTWLHSICFRTAIDHVRHERRRTHQDLSSVAQLSAPNSTSGHAMARIDVDELLGDLDHETRALVMMTSALGLSFDEAAEITGIARGTVASRVSRARERMRRKATR